MTITQIKYFLAIVEYGSFSEAAFEVFISQSSLSKQIKALEDEIGLPLFNRSKKKISLTDAGEIFLKYAEQFIVTYQELAHEISDYRIHMDSELLALGTLPLINDYGISHQLAIFQETMKNIQINITEANQSELLRLMDAKKLNVAFLRLDYLNPEAYDCYPLLCDEFVVVCSKKMVNLLPKENLSLHDLKNVPFLMLVPSSDIQKLCMDMFSQAGIEPRIVSTVHRHLYLLNLVETGMGITILPKQMVNTFMFPNLVTLPFKEARTTTVGIVRLKDSAQKSAETLLYNYFANIDK